MNDDTKISSLCDNSMSSTFIKKVPEVEFTDRLRYCIFKGIAEATSSQYLFHNILSIPA